MNQLWSQMSENLKLLHRVPKRMVGDLGVAGQPRDVEPEISEPGFAVPWPVVVSGLDGRTELLKSIQHPRHTLQQSCWPCTLKSCTVRTWNCYLDAPTEAPNPISILCRFPVPLPVQNLQVFQYLTTSLTWTLEKIGQNYYRVQPHFRNEKSEPDRMTFSEEKRRESVHLGLQTALLSN
jgi:hypothetical protein